MSVGVAVARSSSWGKQRESRRPTLEPVDVAVISPCGWGNLGDAAIVDSVLHAIRTRRPSARLAAFTLNPRDTSSRHRVDAFTCTGFSRPYYTVTEGAPWGRGPSFGADFAPEGEADEPTAVRAWPLDSLRWTARVTPGARRILAAAGAVRNEVRHRALLDKVTERLELVIVAGGGQLDDYWGGALGHPYVLWRWARRARAVNARFVVLSVGTGRLKTPAARGFVRAALASADYRSFRDLGSRELVGAALVEADPVVPDLAYGLPVRARSATLPRSSRPRPLIGVSPIAYRDPRVWPELDRHMYETYIGKLGAVAASLVESGKDLVVFGTDGPDNRCTDDLMQVVQQRLPGLETGRVERRELTTHEELLELLSGVDLVVASRLHGALLAHVMAVPVVALSYERKVRTLMSNMGHGGLCLNIDDFVPAEAVGCIADALSRADDLSATIGRTVAGYRRAVEAQYDRVLAPNAPRAPS